MPTRMYRVSGQQKIKIDAVSHVILSDPECKRKGCVWGIGWQLRDSKGIKAWKMFTAGRLRVRAKQACSVSADDTRALPESTLKCF